jgi:hypothetical protein
MRALGLTSHLLGVSVESMAAEFARGGDALRAVRLFGAGDATWQAMRMVRPPFRAPDYDEHLQAVRTELGDAEFLQAWNEGRALDATQVFSAALDERQ